MQYLSVKVIFTKRFWFNFLLAFLFIPILSAQSEMKQMEIDRAETAIRNLAEGVLVIRLESNRKKIEKLTELLAQKDLSAKNRKNLQRQLDETLAETKERNILLMNNFVEIYNFSEVLFTYDFATEKLSAGEQEGYFLNRDLEIDPTLSLSDRKYLTLRFGTTDMATTSGIEGLIITDDKLQDLTTPFPYAFKDGGFMYIFDRLFDNNNAAARHYPRLIEKINKKLKKYYNEVE